MDTPYEAVAVAVAQRFESIFESEETLKAAWQKFLPFLPFDRTNRWDVILHREMELAWREHGPVVKSALTIADSLAILELLAQTLDYNLFSQVLLNLQNWSLLRYRADTAEADQKALETKWAGKSPSPFDPKAKMFKDASSVPFGLTFNHDLSALKSLRIISQLATPFLSFRVSPKGSTPALVDSGNLSMLGVGSDRYLKLPPGLNVYYFTWDAAPELLDLRDDGRFYDPTIAYGFASKSGGDILQAVMAARLFTTMVFQAIGPGKHKVLLPRMTSLMVITDADPNLLEAISCGLVTTGGAWPVKFHQGSR